MADASNKIVSAITVSCGMGGYLKACLASLKGQTYPVAEIILIDNSCQPQLRQEILNDHPFVKLCPGARGLSYCDSLNKGIGLSRGDFILCLNDDVILDGHFIKEALNGFLAGPKVGMVSGKILRYDRKTIDSAGLFLSLCRTAKERGYGLIDRGQFKKNEYVFGVSGAVAFYRREMLEAVKEGTGYFDPDFHFFYEDLDIAWRAQNKGWKCYFVPSAIAYHRRGGSARPGGINKPYARRYLSDQLHGDLIKNRYLTVIKNESRRDFLLHLPFLLLYDLAAWCYVLFFRPGQIPIFISNLKYLKPALRKRNPEKIK
ncbi:MAG: glycosyltransferase [Candidatus Omnitrophica bacterium]|nr:glycosyltransferase [Candidatus Omnitrophota bacterium]